MEFKEILLRYCGQNAVALEIEEGALYRGCRIWTFKRKITKYRWKGNGYYIFKQTGAIGWNWKDIPDEHKESYIDEFWMGLTNYELEFEEPCELSLCEHSRETARYRLEHEIDRQFTLQNEMIDIL